MLGEQGPKQFRIVFEGARKALRGVFGMELVELPARERVTVRDRKGEIYTFLPYYLSFFFIFIRLDTDDK